MTDQQAPRPVFSVPPADEARLESELQRLASTPIADTEKGITGLGAVTPAALSARGAELSELGLMTPYATLQTAALATNLEAMAAYCEEHGVLLAPHAKTTMSPQVWAAHLRAGAIGFTAATPHQVGVLRSFGVRRIIYANEVADAATARYLAGDPDTEREVELCCYVDSPAAVALLEEALTPVLRRSGRRLPVLVELGYPGGRGGARDLPAALATARAAHESDALSLAGAAAFEGLIGWDGTTESTLAVVRDYLAGLRAFGRAILDDGMLDGGFLSGGFSGPLVLTAGGSCWFDVVVEELAGGWAASDGVAVVLRAGGYALHDHGLLARCSPFVRGTAGGPVEPALQVWARVIGRPEPGLALLDAGRRDVSTDSDLPVLVAGRRGGEPLDVGGLAVVACNDQHAYVRLEDPDNLAVGDLVALGISHCCTTFDKWRVLLTVDETCRVTGLAHTYF